MISRNTYSTKNSETGLKCIAPGRLNDDNSTIPLSIPHPGQLIEKSCWKRQK